MNDQYNIICSEMDIDLKDKSIMGQNSTPLPVINPGDINEKTLADLIKNSTLPTNNISNIINLSPEQLANLNKPYIRQTQILGQEWVVPTREIISRVKDENNPDGYVYVKINGGGVSATAVLILCEEIKELYSDGSYKIRYNPVTNKNVKRMSE